MERATRHRHVDLLAAQKCFQKIASAFPVDFPHRTGKFDICSLQYLLETIEFCCLLFQRALAIATSSRSSLLALSGIKLAFSKPCWSESVIHSASVASAFRPGTAFMCWAFTTIAPSPTDSNMLYSGFQYDAVLSIVACSHLPASSHCVKSSNSCVDAPNSRISCSLPRLKQATISFLCMSTPQHLCKPFP